MRQLSGSSVLYQPQMGMQVVVTLVAEDAVMAELELDMLYYLMEIECPFLDDMRHCLDAKGRLYDDLRGRFQRLVDCSSVRHWMRALPSDDRQRVAQRLLAMGAHLEEPREEV